MNDDEPTEGDFVYQCMIARAKKYDNSTQICIMQLQVTVFKKLIISGQFLLPYCYHAITKQIQSVQPF
jgi:hypothetical protein